MIAPNGYPKIVVAGVGNLLMHDDGVGLHAIALLREDPPSNVLLAQVGTAALHAQDIFEEADLVIVIDAVKAQGDPGEIYYFDLEDAQTDNVHSLHDLGIGGVIKLIPADKRPRVVVVGVEPEIIDYGMELSPAVTAALPKVAETVRGIIDKSKNMSLAKLSATRDILNQ